MASWRLGELRRFPAASRIRASLVLVLLGAAAVLTSACHHAPAPGSSCRVPEQLACVAPDRAVVCDSGSWVELTCRGPRGCVRHGDVDDCDDTVAAEADTCPRNPPTDYACTADRKRALVCKNGRFSLWRECRGPAHCEILDGHNVHCDTTFGEPGDACEKQGTYCCSADGKAMLLCDGNTMAVASSCRGPEGCRVARDAHKVDCDDSLAIEGDPCDQPKRIACSLDGKAELVCGKHTYEKKRECRRGDCKLDGNELFCD
jgi:hypothetical protein